MIGFLLRWVAAVVLVFATYNPTKWNFIAWATENWGTQLPIIALLGIILVIGYVIFLRATFRSIGIFGIILVVALIAALIWVLASQGWLSLEDTTLMTWVGLVAVSFVLAIGLSWSIVRRALSGQADVDDVDD